jgi:hypothetical protein
MRIRSFLLLSAATTCSLVPEAAAFESICVRQDRVKNASQPNGTFPQTAQGMMESSCGAGEDATSVCDEFTAPRGAQLSEHTWMAHQAMALAGLGAFVDDADKEGTGFSYMASGMPALFSSDGKKLAPSVEPLVPWAMAGHTPVPVSPMSGTRLRTPNTIPEFAELGDWSFSLSDYILGNEHCFADNAIIAPNKSWRDSEEGVRDCHSFSTHMGAVNSTHFPTQGKEVYRLYHNLALKTAADCKVFASKFSGDQAVRVAANVRACEREALIFEAVGSHFSGDAWSSGHMWDRWGTPVFQSDASGQVRALSVAMMSGLIHGWRAISRGIPYVRAFQNDQMCMPGSYYVYTPSTAATEASFANDMVFWSYANAGLRPTGGATRWLGGGDDYMFLCPKNLDQGDHMRSAGPLHVNPRFQLSGADSETGALPPASLDWPLRPQFQRAITCLTKGFASVYEAGPKTAGANTTSYLDPDVTDSLEDRCWQQRVTNHAFRLGWKVGVPQLADLADPGIIGNIVLVALPFISQLKGYLKPTAWDVIWFRINAAVLAADVRLRDQAEPDGTDLATMEGSSLVGFTRGADYASLITQGKVTYLEQSSKDSWSVTSGNQYCFNGDADCDARSYCAGMAWTETVDANKKPIRVRAAAGKCLPHEAAVLYAFREAEVPRFCRLESLYELQQGATACAASGNSASGSCDLCVQMARPHVRSVLNGGAATDSLCDAILGSAEVDKLGNAIAWGTSADGDEAARARLWCSR